MKEVSYLEEEHDWKVYIIFVKTVCLVNCLVTRTAKFCFSLITIFAVFTKDIKIDVPSSRQVTPYIKLDADMPLE